MKRRIRLTESDLHRIVRGSVNRVLNEMALYNKSTKQTYDPDSGSWAPSGEDWKWKYTGDGVDRYLWRMKKDAEKEGCVGPHKFPMASWFQKNAYDYFNYLDDWGGQAESMPWVSGPEDDYEMTPEDMYRAIDELRYGNQIGHDNHRTFG